MNIYDMVVYLLRFGYVSKERWLAELLALSIDFYK